MPLMFVLAGISTVYALQKRTYKKYIKERINKLLVPLFFGVLLIMPSITFFAERFHNGFTGNYFQQYILFFTKETDLTGVAGGFTPGHLWFLFYLFIISMISLPIIMLCRKSNIKINVGKIYFPLLFLLFFLPLLSRSIFSISDKSLLKEFMYFLLGYFILSDEIVLEKCKKQCFMVSGISLLCIVYIVLSSNGIIPINKYLDIPISEFYAFSIILAFIGLGGRYMDFSNSVTEYLSKISFGIYLFHFSWVVGIGYYAIKYIPNIVLQNIVILSFSVLFTIVTVEIFRRIFITRMIFGLRK
jgi:peptidoglycan/LPS O-acetylase OafA/YrhL